MAHVHRDERMSPLGAFEGFAVGLLAGAASFLPLLVFQVSESVGGDLPLIDWLLDRPLLAAAYVAAAVALPVGVAARRQPLGTAVWVGIGVLVVFPIGVAVLATIWWNSVGGGSGFFG